MDLGYHVDTASNAIDALRLVDERDYDLALLDLKMPGMNGLELYKQIKERKAGTVAIIVTAYAGGDTAQHALEAGAWKIVSKPVDVTELMRVVEGALGQPMVLVVDDDSELCDALVDVLQERRYRVCIAHSIPQATKRLKDRQYHVVLIDMKLPEGDGSQVFDIVRESNPEARSVLITGYRSEVDQQVRRVLNAGASGVCYKPFDVEKLVQMVAQLSNTKPETTR